MPRQCRFVLCHASVSLLVASRACRQTDNRFAECQDIRQGHGFQHFWAQYDQWMRGMTAPAPPPGASRLADRAKDALAKDPIAV